MNAYLKVTDHIENFRFLMIETLGSPGSGGVLLKNELNGSGGNDLTAFFVIGMVVNVVILIAFFVWALKEWRKK